MRSLLFSLWCLLGLLISCNKENSSKIIKNDSTVNIQGKIENYHPNSSMNEVSYKLPNDIFHKISPIDSFGNYTIEFELERETDIYLNNGKRMNLLVQPGNQISIYTNANDSTLNNTLTNIILKGDNQLANTQFLAYQNELPQYEEEYKNRIIKDDFLKFKLYLDSISQAKERLINKYLANQKIEQILKNWLDAENVISRKKEVLSYESKYAIYVQKQAQTPDHFYESIEPIALISEGMLINSHLTSDFGGDYFNYLTKIALKKSNKPNISWKELYPIINEEILNRNKNNRLFAQIMINNRAGVGFNQNNLDYYESVIPLKDSIFGNSKIGSNLEKQYLEIKKLLENPLLPEKAEIHTFSSESPTDYLEEIIDNAKGKVLYIDNWTTWCIPCIYEFKTSTPDFKKQFDSNVEFVYLCYRSQEDQWKSMIAKYNIEGKHYFIEDDKANIIKQQINLQGYPTYVIIDKKGEIIKSGSDYRPSEAITSEVLTKLITQ